MRGAWHRPTFPLEPDGLWRYAVPMNAMDRNPEGLAHLHFGDGEFVVLTPGRFVLCAVSQRPVALEALRYWDAEAQEAYAGPTEALAAWQARQVP